MLKSFSQLLIKILLAFACLLPMHAANAATTSVVINAYGSPTTECRSYRFCNAVYPKFNLYVGGVKVGATQTTNGSSQNYTFNNVTVPTTGNISIDVFFINDYSCRSRRCSGDRNLVVNAVLIGGQAVTVAGSQIDKGYSYAQATDGLDTYNYSNGIYNTAALRLSFPVFPESTAELIAEYHLDEDAWNGTSNEAKDSASYAGGPFDGQGIGTPIASSLSTNPARPSSNGTCGYAHFQNSSDGSAFQLDNLPINTANSAKTSVSFWMYWTGGENLPIGWSLHGLWFDEYSFGFNTFQYDVYGISHAGLKNRWVHVAAVFTNGNVAGNELYIDGVKRTLTQRAGSPNNSRAYVQSTLQVSGTTGSSQYRFDGGYIDEVKVYNGTITQTQVSADYNAVHACPRVVTNVDANRFNCIAEQETDVATGNLYTQLVGTPFNIKVVALKADGTPETSFSSASDRTAILSFKDNTSGATINFNGGDTVSTKNVLFATSNTSATVPVTGVSMPQAYQNISCEVSEASVVTPSVSDDSFSVRPQHLTLSSNVTNPFIAGNNFTLTATGGTGYNGAPKLLVSNMSAMQTNMLTSTANAAVTDLTNNTMASGTTAATLVLRYHDVGSITFNAGAVLDTSFTNVDHANDCIVGSSSNTPSAGKVGCHIASTALASVGRFKPDHFTATTNTLGAGCSAGGFTYMGQPSLALNTVIEAQSSEDITSKSYNTGTLSHTVRNNTTTITTSRLQKSGVTWAPSSAWTNGVLTVSESTLGYAKSTAPDGPYAHFNINYAMTDSLGDSISFNGNTFTNDSTMRYGRLKLSNAYGSELLPLSAAIEAQYWDGLGYRKNQLDSCTTISPANISMSNYKHSLTACETSLSVTSSANTSTMVNGKLTARLTKPGAGNSGSVDLAVNTHTATGNTCTPTATTATSTGSTWFGSANPTARASFGLNKTPMIYIRENF